MVSRMPTSATTANRVGFSRYVEALAPSITLAASASASTIQIQRIAAASLRATELHIIEGIVYLLCCEKGETSTYNHGSALWGYSGYLSTC